LVDRAGVLERLERLRHLLARLEQVRGVGLDAYLADEDLQRRAERELQLAVQICIDVGAHLVAELGLGAPKDYADVFAKLARGDVVGRDLAERLAAASRQRNVLVHLYLDIDDRKVFEALDRLDDLRAFAAAALRVADEG